MFLFRCLCGSCAEWTMSWRIFMVLATMTAVRGNPAVTLSTESDQHLNSIPQEGNSTQAPTELEGGGELLMATEEFRETGELNVNHYPAQRAAKVVQHYLNTRYGSPHRFIGLHSVQSANAEDVTGLGRKYHLELSVQEVISNTTEKCSAELLFPGGDAKSGPQVQALCDGLLQLDVKARDEAFYQQHRASNNPVSGQNLPDSHGNIDSKMEPFRHLGIVASSFVMLRESNESTLYNMAQVANFTQLETENDQLRFDYLVLLHEMISQEIIRWKMLITWSPTEGVKVLQTEWQPKCHHCEAPPNITTSLLL